MTDTVSVISVPGRREFNVCRSISDYQTEANMAPVPTGEITSVAEPFVSTQILSEFLFYFCRYIYEPPTKLYSRPKTAICMWFTTDN